MTIVSNFSDYWEVTERFRKWPLTISTSKIGQLSADNQLFWDLWKLSRGLLLVILIVSSVQSFTFFPILEVEIVGGHFRNLSVTSQWSEKFETLVIYLKINFLFFSEDFTLISQLVLKLQDFKVILSLFYCGFLHKTSSGHWSRAHYCIQSWAKWCVIIWCTTLKKTDK